MSCRLFLPKLALFSASLASFCAASFLWRSSAVAAFASCIVCLRSSAGLMRGEPLELELEVRR